MKCFLFIFFITITVSAKSDNECRKLILSAVDALYEKNFSKSLLLLTKAENIAESNGLDEDLFLVKNNIALNYYYLMDYSEALDYYFQAYDIALNRLDSNYEMIVLNNIGVLYLKEKKLDEAEKYFYKAYEIAFKNKNSSKITLYGTNLASVYTEKKDFRKVEEYLRIIDPLVVQEPELSIKASAIKAQYEFYRKEYSKSKEIIEKLLPELKSAEYSEYDVIMRILLSKIYDMSEHNVQRAITIAHEALERNKDIQTEVEIYEQLSGLYLKNNEYENAFKYKDLVSVTKDSVNSIKNKILFDNIQTKMKIQSYQKELSDNKKKLDQERRLRYIWITFTTLIIIITGWAVRNNYLRNKQKRVIAEHNKKIIALELENEKNEKLILEKKLKNEIEVKNRKIAAKALQYASKNELIESFINSISNQPEISKNFSLKKELLTLQKQLRNENEWSEFLSHFEEVNKTFLDKLKEKHSDLSSSDIRFISYIYMNLTIKEISALLNITTEACRKRNTRIRKKIGLAEHVSLYDYLSTV